MQALDKKIKKNLLDRKMSETTKLYLGKLLFL